MNDFGFIRVAAAVPKVKVANPRENVAEICSLASEAFDNGTSLVVFPELSVTGYTCGDLFGQETLIKGAEEGIARILKHSEGKETVLVVGTPVPFSGRLYNCAAVISDGRLKGLVPKIFLPAYGEFYESRWFASGADFLSQEGVSEITYAGCTCQISPNLLFQVGKATFAVEICEDLWAPIPPSSYHAMCGAQLIANLSASNEILMKDRYRESLLSQHSSKTYSGYIYSSAGFGESTQDLVYAGAASIWEIGQKLVSRQRYQTKSSMICADIDVERIDNLRRKSTSFHSISPDGTPVSAYRGIYERIAVSQGSDTDFGQKLLRQVEAHPFVPENEIDYRCSEIFSMQVTGLATRLSHIGCKSAVIGISGGLDSTLALLVAVKAFDELGWSRERIIGVTMPGYGTTSRTKNNASDLMEELGISSREISIVAACDQHFKDLGHDPSVHDVTYENSQARERTQILMDLANKEGGIVIGTGDLSELALGWATYNGDHMSMYGVNASIPKTLVRSLVKWVAENKIEGEAKESRRSASEILKDIIDTPISPELLPADKDGNITQVTEDFVGPYELHDFFLYNFIKCGYNPRKIEFLALKAFEGQYDKATIDKWLKTFVRRFFNQQFKRSCLPDGPKVGSVCLSPRGDWRMPSDASAGLFLEQLD